VNLRFVGHRPPQISDEHVDGRLIVVEGTDGAGRSTQIALLKEWLEDEGFAVLDTGFTRSALAGAGIKRAKQGNTLDPLTLNLFYATDFWDRMERHILPALRAGMIALADRYTYSLIARAAVRGVPRDWMEQLYGFAIVPDLVVYLDVEPETLVRRVIARGGFDYWESGQDYLSTDDVHDSFIKYQTDLVEEFRGLAERNAFTVVDASQPAGDVFGRVRTAVAPIVEAMRRDAEVS
jgi:dTMP kinase